MEGYSCIKNRGVHEDRKHYKDCEGGEKWDAVVKSYRVPRISVEALRTSMGSGGRSPRLRRFRQCPLNSKLLYEVSFQCLTRTSVSSYLRRNDSFNEVIRSTRYGAFIQVSLPSVQRVPDLNKPDFVPL